MLNVYVVRVVMVVCAGMGSIGSVCGADGDAQAIAHNWALCDSVSASHLGSIESCLLDNAPPAGCLGGSDLIHFGSNELKNVTACAQRRHENFWQKHEALLKRVGCDSLENVEEFFQTCPADEIGQLLYEASVGAGEITELLTDWRSGEVEQ